MAIRLLCLAAATMALAAPCEAGVRRCVDAQGRVTYQDAFCAGRDESPAKAEGQGAAASAPRNVAAVEVITRVEPQGAQGAWRGPARFQFKHSSVPTDARADAAIELDLLPDGRVRGAAAVAGCRFEGVHTPYESLRIVSVDITVSGCKDERFNARYAGQLNARGSRQQSRLGLHAIVVASALSGDGFRDLSMATIDAVLRR